MAVLAYFFAAILVLVASTDATDYCHMKTCKGSHTMCQFKSPNPSSKCGEVKTASLTPGEKQEILNIHNKLRARVANGQEPKHPAGEIPPLIAQRWANQCDYHHDTCRNNGIVEVGQNIAMQWASGGYSSKFSDLVQMWYDEVKMFNPRGVSHYQDDGKTGHYTQLVWGKTTTIGCGAVRYKQMPGRHTTYLVCNYGPAGNVLAPWVIPVYETRSKSTGAMTGR